MDKKKLWYWGVAFIVGFYTTFVLQSLWNWFVVPALQVPHIGYWLTFGLNAFVGLMLERNEGDKLDEYIERKVAMSVLNACVPDGKQAQLRESLKQEEDHGTWIDASGAIFAKIAGNTFALGVGWVVHTTLT